LKLISYSSTKPYRLTKLAQYLPLQLIAQLPNSPGFGLAAPGNKHQQAKGCFRALYANCCWIADKVLPLSVQAMEAVYHRPRSAPEKCEFLPEPHTDLSGVQQPPQEN
jgi:hypothetical protein